MTNGHDITEMFYSHHLVTQKIEPLLKKYCVKETTRPRNVKLTFHENGFYMTLRRKVAAKLPELQKTTKIYSKVCQFNTLLFSALKNFNSILTILIVSVVHRWFICAHPHHGHSHATFSKHNDGHSMQSISHMDRHLCTQLLSSARQLSNEIF